MTLGSSCLQPANTLVGGFVGIGIKVPKRQLHVRGGLFASVGAPSANVGYSFEEHSGSGLFASQEGGVLSTFLVSARAWLPLSTVMAL